LTSRRWTRDDFQPHGLFRELGIDFRRADIEREPIPFARRFDAVVLTEVIEHWNFQPVPTLRKVAAALRPGGALILSTPDADSAWGRTTKHYPDLAALPQPGQAVGQAEAWIDDHVWQYSRAELVGVLEEAGFAVEWAGHSERSTYTHCCVLARRAAAPGEEESFAARLCAAHAAAAEAPEEEEAGAEEAGARRAEPTGGGPEQASPRCAELEARLEQAEARCATLLDRARAAEADRDALRASTSWRLTAPLRSLATAVRRRS
jgi:SAM-dependent methyltransferase